MTVFERRLLRGVISSWMLLSVCTSILRIGLRISRHLPVYVSSALFFEYVWLLEGVAAGSLAVFVWRFRHHRRRFALSASAAIVAFLASEFAIFGSWFLVRDLLPQSPMPASTTRVFNSMVTVDLTHFFILAVGTVSATLMIGLYRDGADAEIEAAQLETSLAEARLRNVRNQVKPALIRQSLARIEATLPQDTAAAEAALLNLSDFLRLALVRASGHELPPQVEEEYSRLQRVVAEAVAT